MSDKRKKEAEIKRLFEIAEKTPYAPQEMRHLIHDDRKEKLIDAINRLADVIEKKWEQNE